MAKSLSPLVTILDLGTTTKVHVLSQFVSLNKFNLLVRNFLKLRIFSQILEEFPVH